MWFRNIRQCIKPLAYRISFVHLNFHSNGSNAVKLKPIPSLYSQTHLRRLTYKTGNTKTRTGLFRTLDGKVDVSSPEFTENVAKSKAYEEQYQKLLGVATASGGPKGIDRHKNLNKKMLVWDRLKLLFDDYDSVLELGILVGLKSDYGDIPRGSLFTCIGKINGVYCMVMASDATVKGGTLFPVSVKKQLRSQEIALQNRIPYIFVVDSGGAFLPAQAEIFADKEYGGRVFYNEAIMNSQNIPQLSIVVGSCTAGAAYIPTMVQESIIVHQIGTIFLAGPPLVKAALGEIISPEDLGGATIHCSTSGYTDHFAETEEEAFEVGRDVVTSFNITPLGTNKTYDEPVCDPSELSGIIPATEQHRMDSYKVLARITDGSRFHEFKARYGTELITGFGHLHGMLVGFVANNGPMTEKAALKGSHFVQLCDQRQIPLIFLQNNWPDDFDPESEAKQIELGGRIKGEAKLMSVTACAEVPKITVVIGDSVGMGSYTLCGRSFDPNFLFCWPNAHIAITDPEELAGAVNASKDGMSQEESVKVKKELEFKSSAFYASSRLWCDGIVLPHDTRKLLGQCLEIIFQQSEQKTSTYSVIRM